MLRFNNIGRLSPYKIEFKRFCELNYLKLGNLFHTYLTLYCRKKTTLISNVYTRSPCFLDAILISKSFTERQNPKISA